MFRNKVRVAIFILFLSALLAIGLYFLSKSRTFQTFGTLIDRVGTNKKIVALTFDDAPTGQVDEVLAVLREENIRATFYLIGANIEKQPDVARGIMECGHELGNHSYSHRRLVFKSREFIRNEVERTNELIRELGYAGEITFRPPNGKKLLGLPWYLKSRNMKTIMWDVEPDTYAAGNPGALEQYTLEHVRPGSIVLLHPFCVTDCADDRKALSGIIRGLKSQGYEFVTVSELLASGDQFPGTEAREP